MIDAKKEEANKALNEKFGKPEGEDNGERVNVAQIAVEDDFDVDDI